MTVNAPPRTAAYDFKIYSASMDAMEQADILTMKSVSSSTIEDLQGDAMEITALQDMERAPDNQNVLLNHEQRIPEDLMGGLISSKIVLEKGIADLHDVFEVDQVNPRARMAYEQGKRRRLGISIGGIVLDYHIENNGKGAPICKIDHIQLLERSVVGIPAVQRAWVENASIGAFRRSYDPELAPIVKSMWPQPYADIVNGMEDPDQREFFTKGVTARDMGKQRIVWYPAQKQFSIETPNATRPAWVTRNEVAKMLDVPLDDASEIVLKADDADKKAQEARAKKYGIGIKEGGHVTKPSDDVHQIPDEQYGDPVNYAYPMGDASHARNALSRWGDASNRSVYTSEEQTIVGNRIKKRARALGVDVSDDDEKKSLGDDVDMTTKAMPKASDVEVASDGSHEKATGTHTHNHPAYGDQGDDKMHGHSHTHDGDNNHHAGDGHSHDDAEKSTEAEKTADVTDELVTTPDAPSDPVTEPAVSDSAVKALTVSATPEIPTDDPAFLAWKSMGEQLGFMVPLAKCGLVGNDTEAQNVITLVSAIDSGADALSMQIDALMGMLRVPDMDGGMAQYSADALALLTKAGARHSTNDTMLIQGIHDACKSLTGGNCCTPNDAMTSDSPDNPSDADPSDTARGTLPGTQMNLGYDLTPVTSQLEALTKAFSGIDVSVIGANVQKAVEVQLGDAMGVLATLTKGIGEARKELTEARTEIATLTNTPLGRPTQLNRTVQAGEPVATYDDFTAIGKSDISGTRLVKVPDRGLMRLWAAGTTNRPPLEPWQDKLMSEGETSAYKNGLECLVPEKE